MNMTGCNLVKLLVVPNYSLQLCKDARDSSGECWNYLSRKLSCNFAEMTASPPFRDLFLATNLRQVGDCRNYITSYECVFKTWRDKPHKRKWLSSFSLSVLHLIS